MANQCNLPPAKQGLGGEPRHSQGVKENLEPIDYLFILEKKKKMPFVYLLCIASRLLESGKILLTKPQSIGAII